MRKKSLNSKIVQPYFSHDIASRGDKKMMKILEDFGFEGYGLFWSIVEFMHRNELFIGEEYLIAGKHNENKVIKILNEYNLFHKSNNKYYSDRINRNIKKQNEKSAQAFRAATHRWELSALKKAYQEIFGKTPVLSTEEISNYMKYSSTIDNFKDYLPDILYTLKNLKFSNNPEFKPNINWLLSNNNLPKLLNGEFGKLRSWKAHKDYLKSKDTTLDEPIFEVDKIKTRTQAVLYLKENCKNLMFITPDKKNLMKRFDISVEDIRQAQKCS